MIRSDSSREPAVRHRIVLVSAALTAGGAERQLAEMASFWVAQGHQVTLTTWAGDGRSFFPLDPGVRRVHIEVAAREGTLGTLLAVWRRTLQLRRVLKEAGRGGTVVSFLAENNIVAILASLGLPLRVVVSERAHPAHDTTVRPFWRRMRKLLYPRTDVVVVQTRAVAAWVRDVCGKDALVIPNALRRLGERSEPRERLVVSVGRLTRQKGFDLLIRALARIAGHHPDWSAVVFGEGPELEALTRLRDELGLAQRVSFVGVTDDIESWFARAGIVVQPSRFEGFPNVVLEAMGMGAAVISADCPSGPADLIRDGINGRLVPVEDVDALAQAMSDLMSSADTRARLGRAALEVKESFKQDRIMAQWDAALPSGKDVR